MQSSVFYVETNFTSIESDNVFVDCALYLFLLVLYKSLAGGDIILRLDTDLIQLQILRLSFRHSLISPLPLVSKGHASRLMAALPLRLRKPFDKITLVDATISRDGTFGAGGGALIKVSGLVMVLMLFIEDIVYKLSRWPTETPQMPLGYAS